MNALTMPDEITTIIGLEVHVQLKTRSKLFCGCGTEFGAPPNSQICPVCIGAPGALPVINRRAVELAVRTGLALHCSIPPMTKWDRKQYFYPDLPKGYQISQFDLPICADGYLEFDDPARDGETRRVGIIRAHLEEDAGKSMHDEAAGRADSRIDLNRCGTPLLEIVSEPDLRTPAEARVYLTELKLLLTHLGVSDCEMQQGSLRVDANVNLHLAVGDRRVATPIVEVKNMNSFRAVERALAFETERQLARWHDTGETIDDVPKTTRGWDDTAERTFLQREKELSADYRYFPDPDLLPVRLPPSEIESIRESLGELPAEARRRLERQYEIKAYDADVIVHLGPPAIDYFETVAGQCGDGRRASAWIQQDVLRTINDSGGSLQSFPVDAVTLGKLLRKVVQGELDNARARDVFAFLLENRVDVDEACQRLGIAAIDAGEIETLCRELLAANPQVADDVRGGKLQAVGPLIGQAKKKNPNANPKAVRETLLKLIGN